MRRIWKTSLADLPSMEQFRQDKPASDEDEKDTKRTYESRERGKRQEKGVVLEKAKRRVSKARNRKRVSRGRGKWSPRRHRSAYSRAMIPTRTILNPRRGHSLGRLTRATPPEIRQSSPFLLHYSTTNFQRDPPFVPLVIPPREAQPREHYSIPSSRSTSCAETPSHRHLHATIRYTVTDQSTPTGVARNWVTEATTRSQGYASPLPEQILTQRKLGILIQGNLGSPQFDSVTRDFNRDFPVNMDFLSLLLRQEQLEFDAKPQRQKDLHYEKLRRQEADDEIRKAEVRERLDGFANSIYNCNFPLNGTPNMNVPPHNFANRNAN